MLHKRSGESARSRMPVFSRRILESVKPRRAIFYLSILKCEDKDEDDAEDRDRNRSESDEDKVNDGRDYVDIGGYDNGV